MAFIVSPSPIPSSQPEQGITNAFSVDVETFVESNRESFSIPDGFTSERGEREELERNMDAALGLLDEHTTRATFFFVGTAARLLPALVTRCAALGHEVASHGAEHRRLQGIEPAGFRRELSATKSELEDLAGRPVLGFRAPDFSITRDSLWALDVLREVGFLYDSSVYPIRVHDVYGLPGADRSVFTWPNGLVEFPLSTVKALGTAIPFGGGGYFRLYPLWVTARGIAGMNHRGMPAMFYIHPYEVGPIIPRVPGLSAYRRFRHYYRSGSGRQRLAPLLDRYRFGPAIDVLREVGALDQEGDAAR